uniref:Uncharacterized protein n=1 Tax=Solanum tuberosum TaxID=4113 RepID=M0ZZ11_SOLTU
MQAYIILHITAEFVLVNHQQSKLDKEVAMVSTTFSSISSSMCLSYITFGKTSEKRAKKTAKFIFYGIYF